MKTFKNFIAGEWVAPSTGEYFDNVNPADTTDVIGRFPLSSAGDVGWPRFAWESSQTFERARPVQPEAQTF